MAGREPVGIPSARPGLAASAAIALAYGVVLPVLPTVVASSPSPARAIAELMAVYSAAMVVTAPIWVRVCRQLPAHLLVRLSLLGQAAAMIMLLWSSETTMLLLARGLQGIFAGAALPALQTAASRAAGSEGDRSQRLSDLTRAALVGGLLGPGVGGSRRPTTAWSARSSSALPCSCLQPQRSGRRPGPPPLSWPARVRPRAIATSPCWCCWPRWRLRQ